MINDFSYNKLRLLTGLHITTLKKRIATLQELGLISFVGKNKQHICFKSIVSSCSHRNTSIHWCSYEDVKQVEDILFAYLVVEIQRQKDFVKQTIQNANDGNDLETIKKAKRTCKSYGYYDEYKEFGLSYNGIADKLGVSIQKAFSIVKFAIENGLLMKVKRQVQRFVKGIGCFNKYINSDYTFCTKDNAYYILSNVYLLTPLSLGLAND